jgi:hypothetical protein
MKDTLSIDIQGMSVFVKENIPGYINNPFALENDIKSIEYISLMRGRCSFSYIEQCKAIFVTSNYNLVKKVNQFINKTSSTTKVNLIISDTDLITICWIKTDNNPVFTKELLMKYSRITGIEITADFKTCIIEKVNIFEKSGEIDEGTAKEILELHVIKRIYQETAGDLENVEAIDLVQIKDTFLNEKVDERFKDKLAEKDNTIIGLQTQNDKYSNLLYKVARDKASLSRWVFLIVIYGFTIAFEIILIIFGIMEFLSSGFSLATLLYGAVAIIQAVFHIIDLGSNKRINKISMKIYQRVYDVTLDKLFSDKGIK